MGLYRAETYRVEDSVGFQITRLRSAVFAAVDREVAPWGVSSAQAAILIYIAHGRGNRAADIARDYSYDTGSMTRMIDRLVKKGLMRRVRDAADRRSVRLELTSKGDKLAGRLPAVAARALNRLLRGFSRPELDQLKGYLDRMLANVD
ncbi:MAG: winged helix DNA-binding protein [Proteobacteria bacterium]|nr:winged helix DNA-binding protein [Pseudomonadota bacterium]